MTDETDGDPLAVAPPRGAERWREMYPEYLLFSEDNHEWERSASWLQDSLHHPGVKYPFDSLVNEAIRTTKGQWSSRVLELPGGYGTEHRIMAGYAYLAPVPVADRAERAARAKTFRRRSEYYFRRWDELYARWLTRMRRLIRSTERLAVPGLPERESAAVLRAGAGRASGRLLLARYDTLIGNLFEAWHHHFEMLTLGYAAYFNLYETVHRYFPDMADTEIGVLVSGYDGAFAQAHQRLRALADHASTAGLGGLLTGHDYRDALPRLRSTPAGRGFLEHWAECADPWFNVCDDGGLAHTSTSWKDHPEQVWDRVRLLVAHPAPEPAGAEDRGRRAAELLSSLTARLADPGARGHLESSVALARRVSAFVEDHSFYVENWFHLVFWRKMADIGDVLARAGMLPDTGDLYLLNRWEVGQALYETAAVWGSGAPTGMRARLARTVAERRRIVDVLSRWEPPSRLGGRPDPGGDPVMRMLFGVGGAGGARSGAGPAAGPGADDLVGLPSCPGRVTGRVHIVDSGADLARVRPGEILVARTASPVWTVVFDVIGGFVTEIGGVMAHAAIIAREFGVPSVVGVAGARSRLRTGQIVTVDATRGTIRIVDRAAV